MARQPGDVAGQRLATRLRQARERARPSDGGPPTQKWLAHQFSPPRHPQQVSSFEKGREIPGLAVLVELFEILRVPAVPAEFAEWLTDWMIARAEREGPADSVLLGEALEHLGRSTTRVGRRPRGPLRSLADFPGEDPLTVILGDRRELRAKSAADCLIYSGSTTDAMHLSALGCRMENTVIRSDKLLVRMPIEYLERMPEVSESNLLIIGSPAVNWGARILNKNDAIFPFRIDDDVVRRDDEFRADDRMQDETFVSIFWDLVREVGSAEDLAKLDEGVVREKIDENLGHLAPALVDLAHRVLAGSTVKAMMNKFRGLGILDPADQEHHAQVTYGSNDFGVVTLARNPWSRDGRYRAVICGGIHGPGSAAALRELLVRPERFENYPLGAVLEVKLRLDLDWPTRFDKATVSFQTQEYAASSVLEHLEAALAATPNRRMSIFQFMSDESLRSRVEFVRSVLGSVTAPG